MTKRLLDHLVLPTADLDVARARMNALGFTVAPDGRHPFGTANCCVYLADGTFMEPLGIADADETGAAVQHGNVFVARDAAFRLAVGGDGFSALVLKTDDARADDRSFRASGISGGEILDFERPSRDVDGNADVAAFRLAFAADPLSPAAFFFSCQRVRSPKIDRSALELHANGASRIKRIEVVAAGPAAHAPFLSLLLDAEPTGETVWRMANADLVLKPEKNLAAPGLNLSAIAFLTTGLARIAALFNAGAIAYEVAGKSLVVPPAPGQGATFIFEES